MLRFTGGLEVPIMPCNGIMSLCHTYISCHYVTRIRAPLTPRFFFILYTQIKRSIEHACMGQGCARSARAYPCMRAEHACALRMHHYSDCLQSVYISLAVISPLYYVSAICSAVGGGEVPIVPCKLQ